MRPPQVIEQANVAEARGDWSGLKGNYYHVLYGAWLALTRGRRVTFFAGNDLLGRIEANAQDTWIQLKNTDTGNLWTIYSLVRDPTLLPTLIRNALESASQGREWEVHLVTPSRIDEKGIRGFLSDPTSVRRPRSRRGVPPLPHPQEVFRDMIRNAVADWSSISGAYPFSVSDVERVARTVLDQIAASPSVHIANLELDIEDQILERIQNPAEARQAIAAAIGVISRAAAPAELEAITIDVGWLADETGFRQLRDPRLISDVVAACSSQVVSQISCDWKPANFVLRPVVMHTVDEFRRSSYPLMVVVGDSGMGKTSALAFEAAIRQKNGVRAFLRADRLLQVGVVPALGEEFAPFTAWAATPEEVVRFLAAPGKNPDVGPLTIYADDLGTHGTPAEDAQSVLALARDAARRGIKLILSMRLGIWHRLRGCQEFTSVTYNPNHAVGAQPKPSLELSTLSDGEVEQFVSLRRPGGSQTSRLIKWLQRPDHAPLRNAYLLGVFLDQFAVEPSASVDLSSLLCEELRRRCSDISNRYGIEADLVYLAVERLVEAYWNLLPASPGPQDAVDLFESVAPGRGSDLLAAFRARDVLAPVGSLRTTGVSQVAFANPLLFEHALVAILLRKDRGLLDALQRFSPGSDDGIITIISRSNIDDQFPDVLKWADAARSASNLWTPAVCRGLSHRTGSGWPIIGWLTAIANQEERPHFLAAAEALGIMAYHSERARRWISDLYNDPAFEQAFIGRTALAFAVSVNPHWTLSVVQTQVLRAIGWRPASREDLARRADNVRHALDPLVHLDSYEAARLAAGLLRVVRRLDRRFRPPQADLRASYDQVLDEIRGAIAAFGNDGALAGLVIDLKGTSQEKRYRAARAVRRTIFERPDALELREAVLEALGRERGDWTPLLGATFIYALRDAKGIAHALEASGALRSWHGSLALVIAGLVASGEPGAAREILPKDLTAVDPIPQMLLREPLAFAWLLVGLADPSDPLAREVLESLAVVDRLGLQKELIGFAYRGAAVATLGLILLEHPGAVDSLRAARVSFHDLADDTGEGFVYIELDEVCKAYHADICGHARFDDFRRLLVESIGLSVKFPAQVLQKKMREWQFRLENISADELSAVIPSVGDPLALVQGLPQNWQTLRVCRAAVESSVATPALLQYACGICRQFSNAMGDITRDRDAFLFEAESRALIPIGDEDLVRLLLKLPGSNANHFLGVVQEDLELFLHELHSRCKPEDAVEFTWTWTKGCSVWQTVLVGHVFRQSLLWSSLDGTRTAAAIEQIQEGILGLPDSDLRSRYLFLLSRIGMGAGDRAAFPPNTAAGEAATFLDQGLRLAASAIALRSGSAHSVTEADLIDLLGDGVGFLYDPHHWIANGSITWGTGGGNGTLWIPPIPRLALSTASLSYFALDVVGQFCSTWHSISKGLADSTVRGILNGRYEGLPQDKRAELVVKAKAEIESLIGQFGPWSRLESNYGYLLLVLGELAESEKHLLAALALPQFDLGDHARTAYNLACVCARTRRDTECQAHLEEVRLSSPLLLKQAPGDSDLANVWGAQWFRTLVDT